MFPYKRILSLLLIALCAVLVFVGCPTEPEEEEIILFRTWKSTFGDSYVLKTDTLEYAGDSGSYKGAVRAINFFTADMKSGVIIYEYLDGQDQKYYDYDPDTFEKTGGPVDPPGKFNAAYFSDLTASTIKLGGAYSLTENGGHGCEATSLEAALTKFNSQDAAQTYCGTPGTYTKQ
jgi:hypothetical protein